MPGRNETFSRDVRLVVSLPNKVEPNTKFLLRLNVQCASLKYPMFGVVPVSTVRPPQIFKFEVYVLCLKSFKRTLIYILIFKYIIMHL